MLDDFFAWASGVFERVKAARGAVATAFGYVSRQRDALRRFLDDGRLRLDNNASERALRPIAEVATLGSSSARRPRSSRRPALSLIASASSTSSTQSYLADVIRVLPYWPKGRFLELAPKYWTATRASLDAKELERPVGPISVPPAAPQQSASR